MVNRFLIAIAGVVAVMAALVLVPSFTNSSPEQQDLGIEYSRQNLSRQDGRLVATSAEDLLVSNDRSAVYRNLTGASGAEQFSVSSEEMSRLKGLILGTGFMQLPPADYPQKDGLSSLTKYTLKLSSGANSKTITWVDMEASEVSVPSIVTNIGTQLDGIIERRA